MTDNVTELQGSALWKQITLIPRPGRKVDFPRVDPATGETVAQCLIQILTQDELQECAAAAEKYTQLKLKDSKLKKDDKSEGYDQIFNNEVSVQILSRAVRDLEDNKALFPSPRAAAKVLTQDEFGMLMRQYLIVQAELGPVVAEMTEDEMEGFIERLVEGASAHPLAQLSSGAMTSLVMLMAFRLYPSLTGRSLPGKQPEDSLTDTPNDNE